MTMAKSAKNYPRLNTVLPTFKSAKSWQKNEKKLANLG
jgi:hypothetical protein